MKKDSKVITVISILIALILVVIVVIFVRGLFTPKDESSNQQKITTSSEAGASTQNPIPVSNEDLTLTTKEFADKYSGKYISFNGLIQGTNTLKGAKSPHTMLVVGDDINNGSFADGSAFWIISGKSTFSQDLQEFVKNNNSPYETGEYPKVKVVARLSGYDDDYMIAQLEPIVNVDGNSPSVTSR